MELYARWKHLFPVQANLYVYSFTRTSMAQENDNETKTTNKKYNMNECSTSSDLFLLFRIKFSYREALILASTGVTVNTCNAAYLWVSLSACGRKCNKTNKIHNYNEYSTASDPILLFGPVTRQC